MGNLCVWANQSMSGDQAYTTRASQARDIFVDVFNQEDINGNTNRGNEIKLVLGTGFNQEYATTDMVSWANSFEPPIEFDAIAFADYVDAIHDTTTPTTAASVPTPTGSGGGLPAGTYYVYYTWVDGVSGVETSVGSSQATFTNPAGAIPVVTIPSLPAWGAAAPTST